MSAPPLLSVVVPTRDRPIRLRWLLNALYEQSLARDRFEVVVVNGSRDPETAAMLGEHALTGAGIVRVIDSGTAPLPVQRDIGWRASRAPLVLFTDDDCRPPRDWLERAVEAAERHPGAVIQGMTVPDPDELEIRRHATYTRTQEIFPPVPWAQTCNILYPREALERIDGFDLDMPANFAGDDTDLAQRAIEAGAEYVGAREMFTYHAVLEGSLWQMIRWSWRWSDLPYLVKRHPQLRRDLPMWFFWKPSHALLPVALVGVALQRRTRLAPLLFVPWIAWTAPDHGAGPRGRYRSLLALPARALIDLIEIFALVRGSVRHRSVLL